MNSFNSIQVKLPNRNLFDLTHDKKLTTHFGYLTPVMCIDVLPGDIAKNTTEYMARFMPMLAPIMHNVDVSFHYFFVPNRLVWSNWKRFMEQDASTGNVPVLPKIQLANCGIQPGDIADYLGFPDQVTSRNPVARVDAMPIAAVGKIYNDYYRDENLVDEVNDYCNDGDDNSHLNGMMGSKPLLRAYTKDYFTSALPFAQKGLPVSLPISGTADIHWELNNDDVIRNVSGDPVTTDGTLESQGGSLSQVNGGTHQRVYLDNSANLSVDMSTVSAATINDIRVAVRLQEWLELNARGGSRYIEIIYAHFGVRSSDSRLQRPEYLGGLKAPVRISEVLQTSSGSAEMDTPQGNLAGHAISVGSDYTINRFFEEHGYIIGFVSVMPQPSYCQGLLRRFTREHITDYYWKSFALLGEQEIKGREIFCSDNEDFNDSTWGYQERYAEYKYEPSTFHGDFRGSLSYWHLGRIFSTALGQEPELNQDFIECKPTNNERIFSVQSLPVDGQPQATIQPIIMQVVHHFTLNRLIPRFSTPTL